MANIGIYITVIKMEDTKLKINLMDFLHFFLI